eukprot:CAMPEP_0113678844 /NCGR_PEP_ID=MMETSP0038_2-20120614/10219_1 /TAXON_ID=2898 /ORGANISM="Cryptomonas paramecium" /LENGTH=105 /DNA_ID=CAMNT_0000596619 /DNA_START=52 /DNA_END=366 /DNA_ORIENTATION=- /assembly_acc=CAM_ASM_000170
MTKRVRFADQVQSTSTIGRDLPLVIEMADKDLLEYESKALMAAQKAEDARSKARSIVKGGLWSGSPSALSSISRITSETKVHNIQASVSPGFDTDPNFFVASMSW